MKLGLTFALALTFATAHSQQPMPGMDMPGMTMPQTPPAPTSKPGPQPKSAPSITLPIQQLQEPEAPGLQTGSNLPAPELLTNLLTLPPMPLEVFLTLADAHNPTLIQAQRNVDISLQQGRQAALPPNPTLGYSGDHIRGGSYHGGEQGAFFSQDFVLGHKLALRRDVYRAEAASNALAVDIQRTRIHADVASAFVEALAAQQSVTLYERLLKVDLDAETNAHELERVGQADAPDVLNAEIASEQAKVEFVNAQRTFLSAFTRLAALCGQITLTPHPLTGQLAAPPELDSKALVLANIADSPTLKQAQANIALAEARLASARRESIPNLNLKAGEWYSGEELGATTRKAGFESFVEAGIQLPLWNRSQGNTEAARIQLERARQDVIRIQLLTRSRAEPFAQQYQSAHFTVERYRQEILPRARRVYELQVLKYQQMALPYPQVLTSQRLLFTLQLTFTQALKEQWQAAIALQNFTLMGALDEPMSAGTDATNLNLPTTASNP